MYTRTHLTIMAVSTMVVLTMHFLTPYLEGEFSPLSLVLFWAYFAQLGAWAALAACAMWAMFVLSTNSKEKAMESKYFQHGSFDQDDLYEEPCDCGCHMWGQPGPHVVKIDGEWFMCCTH